MRKRDKALSVLLAGVAVVTTAAILLDQKDQKKNSSALGIASSIERQQPEAFSQQASTREDVFDASQANHNGGSQVASQCKSTTGNESTPQREEPTTSGASQQRQYREVVRDNGYDWTTGDFDGNNEDLSRFLYSLTGRY